MNEEKVLSFLDLQKGKNDKFLMQLVFGFDAGFSVLILLFGILLKSIPFSRAGFFVVISFVISIAIFAAWLGLSKNPANQFAYTTVVLLTTFIKLLYGFFVFSTKDLIEYGYPLFSWIHLIVLIFAITVGLYFIVRFYRIFQLLKTNSIQQTHRIIAKRGQMPVWMFLIPACSPMVFVRLFKEPIKNFGIGVGFAFWALSCIWLILILMSFPKCFVAAKYKVSSWFDTNK